MVLVDEPELGMHRAAEARLARGLRAMGRQASAIAATHSPDVLSNSDVMLLVHRNEDGQVRLRSVDHTCPRHWLTSV